MFKFKVKTEFDLPEIDRKIPRKVLQEMAQIIVKEIRDLARRGRKMEDQGKTSQLPTLSDKYRKSAYRLKKGTSKFFRPNAKVSNVTLTGKLLQSLSYELNPSRGEIRIKFNDKRRGEKTTNPQIYDYLLNIDKDYDFLAVGKKLDKPLVEILQDYFDKVIN